MKQLTYQHHVNAKAYQTALLEKEEVHKLTIAQLFKEYASKIGDAFVLADEETDKNLKGEKSQLITKREYSINLS